MITHFISYLFDKIAHIDFPSPIQIVINNLYSKAFNIGFQEFEPPHSYKTLSELFIRKLKLSRKLGQGFISPCDGKIASFGAMEKSFEIKGKNYDSRDVIPFEFNPKSFINIYLSPKDYHRFHAPCDFEIVESLKIEGSLLPVNALSLRMFDNVFSKNRRVALLCRTNDKKMFVFCAVGALNVGNIIIHEKCCFNKGDELGYFDLGSSIIIFFEESINFNADITNNKKVLFGESLINLS